MATFSRIKGMSSGVFPVSKHAHDYRIRQNQLTAAVDAAAAGGGGGKPATCCMQNQNRLNLVVRGGGKLPWHLSFLILIRLGQRFWQKL